MERREEETRELEMRGKERRDVVSREDKMERRGKEWERSEVGRSQMKRNGVEW